MLDGRMSRRQFVGYGMLGVLAAACITNPGDTEAGGVDISDPRLRARPGATTGSASPGWSSLGVTAQRDARLFVPSGYRAGEPAPLAVLLHGAGGSERSLAPFQELAEELGIVLLLPASRAGSWDLTRGFYGPDVPVVDEALARTFERCSIDPRRLALGGFSDGASYALSLGLTNGDLFSHLVAFSPGFSLPQQHVGRPGVFVSHGEADQVLPIGRTSRRIVQSLVEQGYDVTYREFEGGHEIPTDIARQAMEWVRQGPA